jgi:hypothetical protein
MGLQQLLALRKALKVVLEHMAPKFIQFVSICDEEIQHLMLPCESCGGFRIGIPKIDVLGLLLQNFAGTAPIAMKIAEPRSRQTVE